MYKSGALHHRHRMVSRQKKKLCVPCVRREVVPGYIVQFSRQIAHEEITSLLVGELLGHQLFEVRGELLTLLLEAAEVNAQKQFEEYDTCGIEVARSALQRCL